MKLRKLFLLCVVLAMVPLSAVTSRAAGTGVQYVEVADGTEIAVQVFTPPGYVAGNQYPTLVEIEGYGGAVSPSDKTYVDVPDYVTVAISLRGTGCSQGQLDLFSRESAEDAVWIIDQWMPTQSWFNGNVGIYGHSYGGLTGFLVAAAAGRANSPYLKAVAVSGLIDDFYRGILYPGGVSNYGFPLLWGAYFRPNSEHQSHTTALQNDAHCRENYLDHRGSNLAPTPQLVTATYGSPFATEDSWAIQNALLTQINDIKVPIQLGQQYQDEQTGPRGGHVLWENLPDVPKRIAISTGRHNPNDPKLTKRDWLDCWVRNDGVEASNTRGGKTCAEVRDPNKRVLVYFESMGSDRLTPTYASDWPLPDTDWRRMYLRTDGTLGDTAGAPGAVHYASTGNSRHLTLDVGNAVSTGAPLAPYGFTTGLPDTARFTYEFDQTTALAGPLNLSLYASITSADTDFWVEVLDRAPDGKTTFVQRGLLRASANGGFVDALSQKTPDGDIYRPYYKYLDITPVIPGAINKYEVEVFPLGHIWRKGHQMVLQMHAPPVNDPISTWAFEPTTPSVVSIIQDAAHPTSILLPFRPTLPVIRSTTPACGSINGEVCITPAFG